jgi:hypothetical protein
VREQHPLSSAICPSEPRNLSAGGPSRKANHARKRRGERRRSSLGGSDVAREAVPTGVADRHDGTGRDILTRSRRSQ